MDVFTDKSKTDVMASIKDTFTWLENTMCEEHVVDYTCLDCEYDPHQRVKEIKQYHNQNARITITPAKLEQMAKEGAQDALSDFERSQLEAYSRKHKAKYGIEAVDDPKALFCLAQNATDFPTVANRDGVSPCWTKSGTKRVFKPSTGNFLVLVRNHLEFL